MAKASVIIPNYNHARFLRQRIESVLGQTYQDFEVILLDDCSTDDSRSIISEYANDPRVRSEFNEKNSGSTFKQWNKGVRLARGEYIWIAESDDYADKRFLERLVAVLEAKPQVAFAYCQSWRVSEGQPAALADDYLDSIDSSHWKSDFVVDGREECRKYLVHVNPVPNASAVVFRKSAYERAGGTDESLRLCGDWKLWAGMALNGKIAYLAEPLNCYRFHESSVREQSKENGVWTAEGTKVGNWIHRQTQPLVVTAKLKVLRHWRELRSTIRNEFSQVETITSHVADVLPGEGTVRAIAFHLPQFHPIPENDEWWGKGFTEWTNVVKAKPRFEGHYQPHLPADLGFYDLRLPEARAAQAELAAEYGIYGFCYYHYWFNGHQLLERPVTEIWKSGEPDFPFCLCWANENWTRRWDGLESEILLEQKYSLKDDLAHIRNLIPIFADNRYIRIQGKPVFLVYQASVLPQPEKTAELWRREADRAGLGGLFLVRVEGHKETGDARKIGFDYSLEFQPYWPRAWPQIFRQKWWHIRRLGTQEPGLRENLVFDYSSLVKNSLAAPPPPYPRIPAVCPGWDNSPRREHGATIFINSTPEIYEWWLSEVVGRQRAHLQNSNETGITENSLVFINAWNEWAEGNHLEPCQKWGRNYLEATRRALGTPARQSVEYAQS